MQPAPTSFDKDRFSEVLLQSLVVKIIMMLIRVVRNAILARVLGPVDRGILALITSIPELLMTVGNLGYSNAAAYALSREKHEPQQVMGGVLLFVLIMGSGLAAISFQVVQSPWLLRDAPGELVIWQWFIALAIPLFLLKTVQHNLLLVSDKTGQANLISLNESLLPLVIFFLLWGLFDIPALTAAVQSWFITLWLMVLAALLPLGVFFPPRWSVPALRHMLNYGLRGQFDTLFQRMLLRVDYLFVSAMAGAAALGYYAMATAAAELLLMLPQALTLPLYSYLMRSHQDDKRAVTPMVLRIMLAAMALGAVFLALIGQWLIALLFGQAFLPAYPALLWLLPGMVALGYCTLVRLDLLAENRPGSVSVISGTCVALNCVLNVFLIAPFGIVGAAMASSAAYLLAAVALGRLHRQVTSIPISHCLLIRYSDLQALWGYLKHRFS